MATITLYRPVGTTELALIEGLSWASFPAMPHGHKFYAYRGPPTDVLHWREHLLDSERAMYPELGQEDVVKSWDAWGNSRTSAFIVAFEIDEHSPLAPSKWGERSYEVEDINGALVGPISLYQSLHRDE